MVIVITFAQISPYQLAVFYKYDQQLENIFI